MAKLCLIILAITVLSYTSGQHANEDADSYPQALVLCKPGTKNEIRLKPSRKTHKRSLLFVSTLDGKVTALDSQSGRYVWSIMTGPGSMLSSSISKIEISNRGQWVRLIPSLEGNLFKFDGNRFEALPVTADNLLSNSLKVADDVLITGGKDNRGYGIDYTSGKLKYVCAMDGCKFFGNNVVNQDDVLVVRRYTNVIRAADPNTGLEKWNYSVAQHELEFIDNAPDIICEPEKVSDNQETNVDEKSVNDEIILTESDIKIIIPQGLVMAYSTEDAPLWQHRFDSPITNAWLMQDGDLRKIDLMENFQVVPTFEMVDADDDSVETAALYLGIHQQQYYIQQSQAVYRKVTEAAIQHTYRSSDPTYPQIEWKPYVHTAVSRTPLIMGNHLPDDGNYVRRPKRNEGNTALIIRHDNEYPYDGGYYILSEESPLDLEFIFPNKMNDLNIGTGFFHFIKNFWRELMVVASLTLIFNIILLRTSWWLKFWRKQQPAQSHLVNALEAKTEITVQTVSIPNKEEFVSRYYTDFEPIQCLGKGGFGVVFQARNKIDDCEYAIKRICLPNREDAREKVMREVKALAKLDHVGIVRYFNAWLEAPPPGWQENMDKCWEQSEALSSNVVSSDCSAEHDAPPKHSERMMTDIISQLTNNNSFPNVDCNKKEEESGSYSFDQRENAKCLDNSFSNSLHAALESGDSKEVSALEPLILPFQQYIGSNTLNLFEIPVKDGDSHGDSFIVFEDSGCGDRSMSVEKSIPFSDRQENEQGAKGLELILYKKEKSSSDNYMPKRIASSAGFKYPTSKCTKIYLHIQMQLCQKDNLKDWLSVNNSARNKFQVLDFFDQIVSAVEYVHDQGLMHRDLKPSNIFFSMDGTIKVGDFGLVTAMAEENIAHTPFDENRSKKHTDQVGTQLYMSPEQIMGLTYNHKVDIFSLGLVFFELLTPFHTQMERLQVMFNVKQQIFPEDFEREHLEESEFVKLMLSHNPEARPSATDIKNHSILQAFQPRPEVLRHRRTRTVSRTYSTSSSGSLDLSNG